MNPRTVSPRQMHQTVKDFSATHARAVALVLATLLALATMVLLVLLLAREQWKDIDAVQQHAATTGQEVAKESTEVLLRLNRNFQPECSDKALRDFRVEQFLAPYVSDIGVLDVQGRLVCTTTLGVFAQPLALAPADISVRSLQGETVHLSFNVPVMASRSSVRSVVMGMGRFNLVISPGVVKGMLSAGIDAARFLPPQGQSISVFVSPQLPELWQTRLATAEFSDKAVKKFSWDDLAFVAVRPISGTRYLAQSVITLDGFAKNYFFGLWVALLISLVVALLSYAAALPVFLSWNGLAHRIPGLLTDANIICMYQPIVDLRTGQTVGCEVLMRLRDGDAVVYPDQALPAIVSRNLTWQLDQAVVRVAVRELASALPDITDFKVAFNFFPENIKSEKVHALIGGAAQVHKHNGMEFNVEVLEQHYQQSMIAEIAALKKADYSVSVDDFGTGYSNLGTVIAIAPDFLKIDKSFVFEMEDSSVRSGLIPEIISIARAVGAQLVAEGVENEKQMQLLKDLGVEFGQGYWFSKPMLIDGLVRYLDANGPTSAHTV